MDGEEGECHFVDLKRHIEGIRRVLNKLVSILLNLQRHF